MTNRCLYRMMPERMADCRMTYPALPVVARVFRRTSSLPRGPDRAAAARLAGSCALAGLALFLAGAPLPWATAAVIGAALLVALCIEPAIGLIALAGLIPFGRLAAMPLRGVNAVDLLVALTVAAWLAQGVARRRITFRPPPLIWPLLAFVWIAGLSLTQADSWSEGLPEWLKWAEFAALYLAAAQILDHKRLAWVLGGLFLAGLAEMALGAYQFVRQAGPGAFVLMGRFMRAYGTFQQPNPYAGYLGYLAPVAASLALGGLGQWRQQRCRADRGGRPSRRFSCCETTGRRCCRSATTRSACRTPACGRRRAATASWVSPRRRAP